ncbi:uncharacterized protein BJ171DRAFT_535796 [Polychytrium aggregatum]|uniref:uncharacterized protein n=1 Tax=Polychytrium aggregatum TaxID=110093 RepID=UPI0022FF2A42|nr:uncharacterized protein BJ171DRAFT_542896 [Polychytrium aggregatum]XP_052961950.1 uncharacterized protein BJ171DRAFT_535796 [Polychytrium aggregatum]KAI9190659.1 hypothetical protein BJ171DRAFT_542896 [Polychytrium aggregatum]KAI9193012.1 hypothetical protein BJ171DRAFT_535796 [Polychytrium aggregatum]
MMMTRRQRLLSGAASDRLDQEPMRMPPKKRRLSSDWMDVLDQGGDRLSSSSSPCRPGPSTAATVERRGNMIGGSSPLTPTFGMSPSTPSVSPITLPSPSPMNSPTRQSATVVDSPPPGVLVRPPRPVFIRHYSQLTIDHGFKNINPDTLFPHVDVDQSCKHRPNVSLRYIGLRDIVQRTPALTASMQVRHIRCGMRDFDIQSMEKKLFKQCAVLIDDWFKNWKLIKKHRGRIGEYSLIPTLRRQRQIAVDQLVFSQMRDQPPPYRYPITRMDYAEALLPYITVILIQRFSINNSITRWDDFVKRFPGVFDQYTIM